MSMQALQVVPVEDTAAALRALILDDAREDVELLLYELKSKGFAIDATVTHNQDEFLTAIKEGSFDVVLSDYRLPEWTGLDAFAALKATGKDIPFLLVTGTLGEEAAVECIKQGVSDYVLKDRLERLSLAVKRSLEEKRLRESAAAALNALAESEGLARQQFEELDLLYRTTPVCFALVDQDLNFIRVNEAMAKNHGIPAAEHAGRSLRELVPEAYLESVQIYRKVFEAGEPILNIEAQVKRTFAPFELRHYLASFFPVQMTPAAKKSACVVMVDITERKLAEQALGISEERNRELVEHSVYGAASKAFPAMPGQRTGKRSGGGMAEAGRRIRYGAAAAAIGDPEERRAGNRSDGRRHNGIASDGTAAAASAEIRSHWTVSRRNC